MRKVRGLLKASHFIPSLIVSSVAFAFGVHYWWEGPAYVIAFTVFTGQLVVGWSNDLYDFADDQKHQRLNKPLVSGVITEKYFRSWLIFMVPFFISCKPSWALRFQRRFALLARYRLWCGV